MRNYSADPANTYVLPRVYDIEGGQGDIQFFPDPWGLFTDRVLDFRSEMGYDVQEGVAIVRVEDN